MKMPASGSLVVVCCFVTALAGPAWAQDLPALAREALSGKTETVQALRKAGPAGLDAVLTAAGQRLESLRRNQWRLDAPEVSDLRGALDGVAAQRDGWASGLYWFTDLEAAKAEAVKSGRRILSLRLLGKLDEEYCCANSRFFRTVLYANQAVSKVLREHYVLHWKSVRPAPLLTIDMGDGRRIKRTITGNSIHYVLDAEGKVIDALPGIYSPAAFLQGLERSREQAAGSSESEGRAWHGRKAHDLCMEWLAAAARAGMYDHVIGALVETPEQARETWRKVAKEAFPASSGGFDEKADLMTHQALFLKQSLRFNQGDSISLKATGQDRSNPAATERTTEFPLPTEFDPPKGMVERPILKQTVVPLELTKGGVPKTPPFPPSADFDPPQIPKGMVEGPVMKKTLPGNANEALDPASPAQSGPSLAGRMTQASWAAIAEPCRPWVRLDESSRRMMMQKLPEEVMTAEELKNGKPDHAGTAFGRLLERFEEAIARDMVRNEYYYHTQIHQWLEEDKDGSLAGDVEALNRRVYQELFLTPDYDAWLGLVPEDTYTALEKDGCACDKGAPPMRQPER